MRAVDDERPPESDAEAERIAEMRARMEAMFGGGEAPAPEPPAAEAPAVEAPPEPAPPAAADDDDAAMRARMDALFGGGGDSPAAEAETPPAATADEPSADETKNRGLFGRRKKSRAPDAPTDDLGEELSKLREERGPHHGRDDGRASRRRPTSTTSGSAWRPAPSSSTTAEITASSRATRGRPRSTPGRR